MVAKNAPDFNQIISGFLFDFVSINKKIKYANPVNKAIDENTIDNQK